MHRKRLYNNLCAFQRKILIRIVYVGLEEHVFHPVQKTAVFRPFGVSAFLYRNFDGDKRHLVGFDNDSFKAFIQLLPMITLGQLRLRKSGKGAACAKETNVFRKQR